VEEGVSRDCGSLPGVHITTKSPHRPYFPLDHRAQAPWPLCRYPVTNLQALTSTESNDAARPKSRRGFALRHSDQSKSGPAACSWEQSEIKGWKEAGKQGNGGWSKSNLEGWSGDRKQCDLEWSLNSCGLEIFSSPGDPTQRNKSFVAALSM